MSPERRELDKNDDFANAWLSPSNPGSEKKASPVRQNLEAIKSYAYEAFDKIDTNNNGFIETDELYAAMDNADTPMRDKSYIMFLLSNQADIAASASEGAPEHKDGISRVDLELYFRLILSLVT
ncbi:MAG: hypothetical protein SGJ27_30350 [Candidatus Melainabacteria bacterium]|nr:hypothetical protein [Candidatus Melainabacteria bacterium]